MAPDDFFYFKGNREYVHSSSIFDYIISKESIVAPVDIDFSLSRTFSRKWFLLNKPPHNGDENIIGQYKDASHDYFIIESDEDIKDRRAYDENEMVMKLQFIDLEVHIQDGILNFTFIEKVNAAFKSLLQKSVFENRSYSYFFVRLKISSIPKDGFKILYKRVVAGKFFEGEIVEHDKSIGFIYFMGKEKL